MRLALLAATKRTRHTLKSNGVKLVSAMKNILDTPEGIILESLLEGMNQYYSAELSQKVTRGMWETRNKGNFPGGTVMYGYRVENRKVIIHEDEAQIVVDESANHSTLANCDENEAQTVVRNLR